MSDPRTHEVDGDEGMPAEFVDTPDVRPSDGDPPEGDAVADAATTTDDGIRDVPSSRT